MVGFNKVSEGEGGFSATVRGLDLTNLRYFFSRIKERTIIHSSFIEAVCKSEYIRFDKFCHTHGMSPCCVFSLRLFLITWTYDLGEELVSGPYTPPPAEQLIVHTQ